MSLRHITVIYPNARDEAVCKAIANADVQGDWVVSAGRGVKERNIVAEAEASQSLVDRLQEILQKEEPFRLLINAVEVSLPEPEMGEEEKQEKKKKAQRVMREELHKKVAGGAVCDRYFLLLVFFSTIVAAIGMIEDNVAVLIGAMVIAPFLAPNLALSLSAALGDYALMRRAVVTNLAGTMLALAVSAAIGFFWRFDGSPHELMARTEVYISAVFLALASGGAAVLSLTRGLSSVMVGVMVAVALLPPMAATGIFLGKGMLTEATGAALLLATNVVCINLSAKLVFFFQAVSPRTWWQKKKAKRSLGWFILGWALALAGLVFIILKTSSSAYAGFY